MTNSYPIHWNFLNTESEFSSDMDTVFEQIKSCHLKDENSTDISSSTLSEESVSAVCSGVGNADNMVSQQQLEANVSDMSDGTAHNLDSCEVNINDLPDEILLKIFSHMSFSELMDVIQKVCTRWKRVSQDAQLWSDKEFLITSQKLEHFTYFKSAKTDQEAIQTFSNCPNLCRVSMWRGAKSRVLRALYNNCHRLSMLHLASTQKLSYEVLKKLVENCSRIHTLRISNELLKSQKFSKAVSQFHQLRVLELQEHFMKNPPQLRPLGDGCPQLAVVYFGHMTVDMDDLRYFVNAKRNTLKTIYIKWTMENRRCVLPVLSVCADSLECLELYEYDVAHEEAREAFTALGSLKNLNDLKMSIIDPAPPGAAALAFDLRTGGLPKLRVLHLQDGHGLDDDTVIAICRGCPVLEELELREAERLSDAAFSQIYRLQHLEILDVSGCVGLGGALMPCLARLPRLHTLRMEELDCTELQPGLSSILQMSSLQCLWLNYATLYGMPFDKFPDKLVNLRELHMCSCQVDNEAIDFLILQMPGLQIHFTMHDTAVELPQNPMGPEQDVNYVEIEYAEEDSDEALSTSESEEDSFG